MNDKQKTVDASKAYIVTQGQTGGSNTVNVYGNKYYPITKEIGDLLDQNIRLLKEKYPSMVVRLDADVHSSRGKNIIETLHPFFQKYKLGFYDNTSMFSGTFPDYPMTIVTDPNSEAFAKDLINALSPIIKSKINILLMLRVENFARLYIYGSASFNENGEAEID